MKCSNKAFSLVELVVVVTILGLLTAFAIPRVGYYKGQAVIDTAANNITLLNIAVHKYRVKSFVNLNLAIASARTSENAGRSDGQVLFEELTRRVLVNQETGMTEQYLTLKSTGSKLVGGKSVPLEIRWLNNEDIPPDSGYDEREAFSEPVSKYYKFEWIPERNQYAAKRRDGVDVEFPATIPVDGSEEELKGKFDAAGRTPRLWDGKKKN